MDKISNISSLDSFFFQLRPQYFQIDHSFAKNMKSGTTYRLQVYKGIQKIDEMSEPIKARLVGGKIMLDSIGLNFNLALFNPKKAISFSIIILETRPQQAQIEIAKHIIKSSDYIIKFINEGKSVHRGDVELINGFKLTYELFVHNSKIGLNQTVQKHQIKGQGRGRMTNSMYTPIKGGYATDTLSQSDAEESIKQGTSRNFTKKISRRRGHQGKLKLNNTNSDAYSQREVSVSSRKKCDITKNDCDSSLINRSNILQQGQQRQNKSQNLVFLARRDSNASQILMQVQPSLQEKGMSCIEMQTSQSQIIESKQEESTVDVSKKCNIDLFCGIQDINSSNVSFSHNKSSHRISIKTRESFYEIPLLKLKASTMQRHFSSYSDTPEQSAKKQFQSQRQYLFYILFSLISIFLLYNAIMPSRRV